MATTDYWGSKPIDWSKPFDMTGTTVPVIRDSTNIPAPVNSYLMDAQGRWVEVAWINGQWQPLHPPWQIGTYQWGTLPAIPVCSTCGGEELKAQQHYQKRVEELTTQYEKGVEKERAVVKELEKEGFIAVRSAGSHGPFDVIAIKFENRTIKLVQVKLTSDDNYNHQPELDKLTKASPSGGYWIDSILRVYHKGKKGFKEWVA